MVYVEKIKEIFDKYQIFLIDGRLFYYNYSFYEYIEMLDLKYVPKGSDILSFNDLDFCEEVVLIRQFEIVLHYLKMGEKFE